ncbi:uncharacterized protein LOC127701329 [Mytilus californianus]|uniref:uncharacterized protein LOC127701329 n=1 Tax=Mytilus californianus TaxID=6549 RepID=UPI002245E393|nr:uncharacterized protein LOC127701329 [Mytilus californianus]
MEEPVSPTVSSVKKRKLSKSDIGEFPKQVSSWTQNHLDVLGIFYDSRPLVDLNILIDKASSPVIPKLPTCFQPVIDWLKYYFDYNVRDYDDHRNIDEHKKDVEQMTSCRTRLLNESSGSHLQYMLKNIPENEEDSVKFKSLIATIWSSAIEFVEDLIEYMVIKTQKATIPEMRYRDIHRSFLHVCGLKVRSGESKKQVLEVRKYFVCSEPDLRCTISAKDKDDPFVPSLLLIGKVKKKKERQRMKHEKFTASELNRFARNVLGQHGGELLLERDFSPFMSYEGSTLVFGAMCIGTQIIFTALEMDGEHFLAITTPEEASDEENVGSSTIFYTKPYDILNSEDRCEMYEGLLRFACFQRNYVF